MYGDSRLPWMVLNIAVYFETVCVAFSDTFQKGHTGVAQNTKNRSTPCMYQAPCR